MEEKTIVGIASAAGGGIGIIRVSGSESMKIVDSIFHPGKFNNEENEALIDKSYLQQQKSHTIHYGFIIDGNNEVVDEVMVSVRKRLQLIRERMLLKLIAMVAIIYYRELCSFY